MTAKHPEGLKKKELKRFRDLLLEKKEEILKNAKRTLNEDMTLDQDDLPDEMDLASSEYMQSFTFRLRVAYIAAGISNTDLMAETTPGIEPPTRSPWTPRSGHAPSVDLARPSRIEPPPCEGRAQGPHHPRR